MSRKQQFRLRPRHLLLFMLAWVVTAIFYLWYTNTGQFMQDVNAPTDPILLLPQISPSLSLHQIMPCWNTIFQLHILGHIIHDDPLQYTINTSFTVAGCITATSNDQLRSLLSATNLMLQQLLIAPSSISKPAISYRDTLVLRRIIGIIFHQNDLRPHIEYQDFLRTIRKLSVLPKYQTVHLNKTFFNIHISKSGGSSICHTFNNLPFKQLSLPDRSVCNYRYSASSMSCNEMYDKAKPYDMVAKESALDVMDSLHPELCDNFIYLLPFRNPLEKAMSYIQSVNMLTIDNPHQLYRKTTDLNHSPETHAHVQQLDNSDLECLSKPIVINGIPYRRIMHGADFKGLFAEWFDAENDNETLMHSFRDYDKLRKFYKDESKKLDIKIDGCYQKNAKEDDEWVYEFVDKENKVGSEFLVRRNDRRFMFAGFRLSRSSTSNTFTSWLGYGDKYRWPHSAEYNPRHVINTQHFVNAVWLMMGIDYVLPLWRFYDSDKIEDGPNSIVFGMKSKIWNKTFEDIVQYFTDKGYESNGREWTYWSFVGHNEGRKDHIRADNVQLTEQDLAMLKKWNRFDIQLFKLAQWIANVDVEYLSM